MKKIIHHLRRQPEETRRHILRITMLILTVIIIMFWIFSLGKNFSSSETQTKIKQDLQPFSVLKDDIVSGYQDASDINLPGMGQ